MDLLPSPLDLQAIVGSAHDGEAARIAARAGRSADRVALRQAAEDFEAVFLAQMLAPMFETLESDSMFGGGPGEEIYRSMMVEEYGRTLARNGGVGIADQVERELLRIQEAASNE